MSEKQLCAAEEQLYMERKEHSPVSDHSRRGSKLFSLSDSIEFPSLSLKRPANKLLKMPRFPSQAKKFRPLLQESDYSLHGSNREQLSLSLSNSSSSTPKSPTQPDLNCDQFNVKFESGCPNKFWLYADTAALYDIQAVINVSLGVIDNISF